MTGIVFGMVISFLLTQPYVLRGFLKIQTYIFSFFPGEVSKFFRGQTVITALFFWAMIFLGFLIWFIRGDPFEAEAESRKERFDVIDPQEFGENSDD